MPKHFIISDTHFNHNNIIDYAERPFASVDEMNEYMIAKWNRTISPDDIVYHLGDFGFGNRTEIKNFIERLNGNIILIKGNHDRFPNIVYESAGMIVLKYGEFNVHQIGEADGLPIYATHNPSYLVHPFRIDRRIFFGHIHQYVNCIEGTSKNICCSVERLDYAPLCLEDFFAAKGVTSLKFFGIKENVIDKSQLI